MSLSRAELQDGARKALGEGAIAPDADKSWQQIADLGWLMLAVPEAQGGLGLGAEAIAAIHVELGRALVPGPAIAQMLVIEALAAAGQPDLLERAMAGEKMTVGHFACDADAASYILVGGESAIRLVPREAVQLVAHESWDETRRLFSVEGDAPGITIAEGDAARSLAEHLKKRLCLMLAADSLGGADAILALTTDYLGTRKQFDRPLAMFQALKHRVADMKVKLAAAEALLWSRAKDPHATLAQMGALKAHACRTFADIAEEAVQLHGGIGLTAEHHCHLFLKRAMLNAALGGDADYWEEIAGRDLLGLMDKIS
jgi:alkylation response protein AidB-like acyl-CoA dehydrogenase